MRPHNFAVVAGVLLLLALGLLIGGRGDLKAGTQREEPPLHTVTVIGEGEVRVRPDLAVVTVGILTTGSSALEAETSLAAVLRSVQAAMVAAGAEEQGMEVQPLTVSNTTAGAGGPPAIVGYQGRILVRATVKNLFKVEPVIESALMAGATSVESVQYASAQPEHVHHQAMQAALENARDRATALVRAAGESLGELRAVEVLEVPAVQSAQATPPLLIYRARVRATYAY